MSNSTCLRIVFTFDIDRLDNNLFGINRLKVRYNTITLIYGGYGRRRRFDVVA